MQDSKLIKLLRSCSKEELQAFRKWVYSPYFGANVNVPLLYDYVRKYGPDFSSKGLNRERVFAALFPDANYRENRLQKLMSELVSLLERFWVYEETKKTKGREMTIRLANIYRQRNCRNYWEEELVGIKADLRAVSLKDATYYYDQLQLELAIHEAIEEGGEKDAEPNLQNVSDHLDYFYLINKLKYYYKAINFQEFKSHEYDYGMMDSLLVHIAEGDYDIPAIQIYYYGLKCFLEFEEEAHFYELKRLLEAHVQMLTKQELKVMFSIAINYCILQLNKGNRDYLRMIFELYKFEIEKEIVFENGQIPAATYRNITTTASLLDELDWLTYFLEEYKEAVDPKDYALNLGQLYLRQSEYEKIIELFRVADYGDVLFVLSAKGLLLKAYYELKMKFVDDYDYEEVLDAHITSFTSFLHRRKKELPRHFVFYLNLMHYMKALVRIQQAPKLDQAQLAQLLEDIQANKSIAEKHWLMRRIKELLK